MAINNLPKLLLRHLPAILIILGVSVIYFLPQLQGKVIQAGDSVSYLGMANEINTFKKETGEVSLWTNSIFGGMPTYQISSNQPGNILKHVFNAMKLYIPRPIGLFFAMAITFYFLLTYMKVNRWLSILGALAFAFASGNVILLEAGHNTKLKVFTSFPILLLGMFMVFKNKYWQGGIVFALGLGINLYCNHLQMTYYFFLALGIYGIAEVINRWRQNDLASLGKGVGVLVLATLVALGSSSSKLLTTQEYAKDTMRGEPILTPKSTEIKSSSETKGLAWDYAMQWSNGTLDLVAGIIPGVAGGSSTEKLGKKSALYKDLSRKGATLGNNFKAQLYWGKLPGTAGPYYYGAILCFLFFMGLILVKGPLKWAIAVILPVFMILSMGRHFEWFNHLLFDYLPLLNKFRAPNSALWVSGFFVPLLGVLAISEVVNGKVTKESALFATKIAFGITGGFCLIFGLLGPSLFDFVNPGDARLEQAGYSMQALYDDRASYLRADAFRSFFLILLAAGAMWAYLTNRIKANWLIGIVVILAFGDIFSIDKRYVDHQDFVNNTSYQQNFTPRPVDQEILKDKDPNYRVLDLSINTFNSSSSSYFHKTIGGYNAAKLQRYDDIITYYLSKGDQGVLAMLNTKYVITQDQKAQRFPGLGNAWMVNKIRTVNTPNEEIEALAGLDASVEAVVHQEFQSYVDQLNPNGSGSIALTAYQPNKLTYESNSQAEELAVFSEVWYGPNKGWNAYIDGELVDHIRANYILRALKIPTGKHTIEFKFEPSTYRIGKMLTIIFSLLILLSFLWVLYSYFINYEPEVETVAPVEKNKPLAKTKSKSKSKSKGKSKPNKKK